MQRRLVLAAVMVAALAAKAHAQRPVSFTVAGGPASLQGSSVGWHALGSIGLSWPMQPIGIRVDAAHSRFTAKAAGPDQALTSATLNLSYRLPMTNSPLSPYLITGAGPYRVECYGAVSCDGSTRFGWNAGLGTKFVGLGLKGLVESRLHVFNAGTGSLRSVPLTIGLTF